MRSFQIFLRQSSRIKTALEYPIAPRSVIKRDRRPNRIPSRNTSKGDHECSRPDRFLTRLAQRDSGFVEVKQGSPAMEICKYANKKVDLIVISTHGRSGLSHAVIGSTAERVVRHASCPVLVVPARRKAANKLTN
jgi:hypothetical protein